MKKTVLLAAVVLCISVVLFGCDEFFLIGGLEPVSTCSHEYVWYEGVAPTSDEKGRTPHEACSLCGDVRVEARELAYTSSLAELLCPPLQRLDDLGLTDKEKSIVLSMYYSLMSFEETCEIRTELLEEDLTLMIDTLYVAFPELIQTDFSCSYGVIGDVVVEVSFDYAMSSNEYAEAANLLAQRIKSVLGWTEGMSAVEYERYVYEHIVSVCSYDIYAENSANAYGALIGTRAKCDGYANAFSLLMHSRGISCYVVPGVADEGLHAWNIVEIDGEYYNVDVTWGDDPLNYAYFNLSDALIGDLRVPDEAIARIFPECDANGLSMPELFGVLVESGEDTLLAIESYVSEAAQRGDERIYVRFTADDMPFEEIYEKATDIIEKSYGEKYPVYRIERCYVPEMKYIEFYIRFVE